MKINEGTTDRGVRVVAGIVLLVLAFTQVVGGVLGIILGIVGGVLLVTGAVGFCPLYTLIGVSTCKPRT